MAWWGWLALGVVIGCAWVIVADLALRWWLERPRAPRPFDWHRDAPEYRYAKDRHVKVIP